MANTVNYVLDINFKNALKAADEFASKLDSSISDAMKQNRGFTGLMQGFNKINEKQEKFHKLQKAYSTAESLRQKRLNNELGKHYNELARNLQGVNDKLTSSVGLREAEREELEKQKALLQDELRIADQLETNFEAFEKSHKASAVILAKEVDSLGVMAERIAQSAESAKELKASLKGLIDPGKLGENLESAAERAADVFKDGIDVQALSRDLGKGLSKGINVAFKAMSGGSGAIMAIGGALAGSVAALGLLVAAFISVDKKVKEFNKELVKTHGALSLMRLGGGDLNRGLLIVNHAVKDLVSNLGVTEQEATALFDSLDRGGLTLDRFTHGLTKAEDKQEALQKSLRGMYSAANLMGVGLSEYADNLTNYVDDLAMSVDSVNESFASIANMASKAGFGTRRFYSMVVQATSGQASLNTRLEDTGDLLMRMSKIMGQKKAAELTGKFAQGLSGMSTQERLQMTIQSRGGMSDIIRREGRAQTQTFGQRANVGAMSTAFARSGQSAIAAPVVTAIRDLQGLTENATAEQREQANQNLQQQIRELSPQNQEDLINSLLSSSDRDAQQSGQQLRDVVTLMRGQSGNLAAQTEAMSAFGARGAMAATLARVEGVLGRQFDVSNPRAVEQLIAMENIGQITSEQRQQLTRMVSSSRSQYDELVRMRDQQGELSAEQQSRLEELGFTIERGADGQKRILQATYGDNHQILTRGLPIENARDIFQLQNEAISGNKQAMESAEGIALQTMDATVSTADIIENQVVQLLQGVYETLSQFIQPILEDVLRLMPNQEGASTLDKFRMKREMTTDISQRIQTIDASDRNRARRMQELEKKLTKDSGASEQEKTQAREEMERIRAERSAAQEQRRNLVDVRSRVARGEGVGDVQVQEQRVADVSAREMASHPGALLETAGQAIADAVVGGNRATDVGRGQLANYASEAEARRAGVDPSNMRRFTLTRQATAQERLQRMLATSPVGAASAATAAGTPAPGATPAPAPGAAPAAGTTPAGGAAPTPVATTPPPARVTEAANAPTVEAVTEAHEDAQAHNQRQRREQRQRNAIEDRNMERLIKGKEMGDGIAVSALPDAIATADAKMRLLEGLTEAQLQDPALVGRLLGGTATPQDIGGLAADRQGIARALGSRLAPTPNDFIYQNSGGRSVITPINSEDQIMGMRPGGPIANATGRGTGGNVTINVNGGDERRVFEVVRRAIQQAGITPNRVPSGAT